MPTVARRLLCIGLMAVIGASLVQAALFQYSVPFARGNDRNGKPQTPGVASLWLPPTWETVRGVFLLGQLGIEYDLLASAEMRQVFREEGIGVVYFTPHISGTFEYWKGGTEGERLLKALDDLAARSGHPEVARVPWITAGHSTAGIYCRNVAYWKPERVAGIVHVKSGNFWQESAKPPAPASFAGVPLVAINGQMESFGPGKVDEPMDGKAEIDTRYGRETQYVYARQDLQRLRAVDAQYLVAEVPEPGADHFHAGPSLYAFAAIFIKKTGQYRLPKLPLPAGNAPVPPRPVRAEDGWLVDPDYNNPTILAAPYAAYTGDRVKAMWHYDQEIAEAAQRWLRNLGRHQCVTGPACTWLDEGDGWSFTAKSEYLDAMPDSFWGPFVGMKVGHAEAPIVLGAKFYEAVLREGPDRFRMLRPMPGRKGGYDPANIYAYSPGDDKVRSTIRWGSLPFPALKGTKQKITFPALPDLSADGTVALQATASSGLPIYYEADAGPIAIKDGHVVVSDLPTNAQYPIECKVTAWQIGRRIGEVVEPAAPVSVTFKVVKP
jgi:hypothetical protein